jgi:hypothetical protein
VKIWEGEPEIATTSWRGGFYLDHEDLNLMFDRKPNTFVHSLTEDDAAGPSVVFHNSIVLRDVQIRTRPNFWLDRYMDMCLYVDDENISCTSADFKIGPGEWFFFKVTNMYLETTFNLL